MSVRYQLSLRVPTRVEFATRQAWLADPDFMAHNAGWNIDVPGYDPRTPAAHERGTSTRSGDSCPWRRQICGERTHRA